ncbi:DNA-directed RNA polymerases IV and V subunit 2-like protein [Tanacetum coccineum]|uniref:DNA-directed RNA polymerase n=1 Tax=Tanacetum coccineum TaxID=301880 RepID=A0ABQ5G296_9ASTR
MLRLHCEWWAEIWHGYLSNSFLVTCRGPYSLALRTFLSVLILLIMDDAISLSVCCLSGIVSLSNSSPLSDAFLGNVAFGCRISVGVCKWKCSKSRRFLHGCLASSLATLANEVRLDARIVQDSYERKDGGKLGKRRAAVEDCGLGGKEFGGVSNGMVSEHERSNLLDVLLQSGMEELAYNMPILLGRKHKVFFNGDWVGVCDDAASLVEIIQDDKNREVCIFSDAGRIMRLLLVVENLKNIKFLKSGDYSFQSLLDHGIIELIGPKRMKIATQHGDLSCGLIPFANHDHAKRVLFQAQKHSQQAIGYSTTNPNIGVDTLAHNLFYPQKPLFRTVLSDCLGAPKYSNGQRLQSRDEYYNGQMCYYTMPLPKVIRKVLPKQNHLQLPRNAVGVKKRKLACWKQSENRIPSRKLISLFIPFALVARWWVGSGKKSKWVSVETCHIETIHICSDELLEQLPFVDRVYSYVEFGRLQARDMLQHLWTGPISNASVDVVQGSRSVEVRPVNVTQRSRSPRKKSREGGVFKRLGSREKSVSARSDSYNQRSHSRYTEVLSESEDNGGGHWKSSSKKKKPNREEDDLSQLWVCKETDPFTPRIRYFDFPKTRMPSYIKTYDGSEDPEDHLKKFQTAAKTERWAMPT